ncbi:MAG: alanine--glyoxylate aminotransferase family protein [Candidatus Coatesbacteria bacterium]|nr:alanine--glyoxylate aminotransferase family protein [Candidatus Coatesbacteria bacterium]
MKFKKLFIPGPTEVRKDVLERMAWPMISHRGGDFVAFFNQLTPKLKKLLATKDDVFVSTSASTGVMEGAVLNCVEKRCLNVTCGAFGERWHEITLACGHEADILQSEEWGMANRIDVVDKALATGKYDAVTMQINETSTGIMNDYHEFAEMMKKYPDVMFLVDAVSAMAAVDIKVDELGMDVCLAGVQKAFAAPPGITVFSVSEKAMEKSRKAKRKGYYFDFDVFKKYAEKGQTPTTPAISLFYALDYKIDQMFEEGLENRYRRHVEMAEYARAWAKDRFDTFAEDGYQSVTLTTVRNSRAISVADLSKFLADKYALQIANGYGKLKEKTFRVGHMGDLTLDEVKELLGRIDEYLGV